MDPSLVAVLAATLASLPGGSTLADTVAPAPAPAPADDIIVRYRPGVEGAQRRDVRQDADVRREQGLPLARTEVVEPEEGVSVAGALADLERSDEVLYAEPDAIRQTAAVPNDRYFPYQWGLNNTGQVPGANDADIDAPEAWDTATGASGVRVAVIDTGADLGHPDLAPNLWTNPAETPANGRDDDANGFVDDVRGADFVDGDGVPDDANGHGTHVAGTVAAQGNDGAGVTGVAWDAALLPLRTLGADGSGSTSDTMRAYAYAARAGARVVNLSLGGSQFVRAERDAIAALPEVLFVVAAGNEGADNDTTGSYPCNYDLPNVVCVAATDSYDRLASFSNRGAVTVDLAAPGVDIASTYPRSGGGYAYLSGTSMAAPHVAGAAALLLARAPEAGAAALRRALLTGVDPLRDLSGRTVTGGRLNARGALGVLGGTTGDQQVVPAPAPQPQPQPAPAPQPSPPPQGAEPAPPPGGDTGSSPAPTPSTAPSPIADRNAPLLRVTARPTSSLRDLLRRRAVRTEVSCSEACRTVAELTLPAEAARRLGFGRVTRPVVLARTSATRSRAGTFARNLRLSATERRRLSRARSVRLHVRVRATDPAGNTSNRLTRLSLRGR